MKPFLDYKEVQQVLGCKQSMAYKIIRHLNDELKKQGFIILPGKVSRKYFNERYYG